MQLSACQFNSGVRLTTAALLVLHLSADVARAQTTSSTVVKSTTKARAPYLQRGDELEKTYRAYRAQLESFFHALQKRLEKEAPELLAELAPPAAVPYGYQMRPNLIPDTPRRSGSGLVLSPFSWPRLERALERDRSKVDTLRLRLRNVVHAADNDRRREYSALVDEYKKLVASQKLIENQIQYNRFWQGDIATHPVWYGKLKRLQRVALERQWVNDSLSLVDAQFKDGLRARTDSLSRQIEDWIKKSPTPDFVHIDHPDAHRWVVRVPVYTDIQDSAFVEGFREAIETGWRVRDGEDDFSMKLDIRRVSPSALYPGGHIPARGAHIDLDAHAARFPQDGVVLTTGGNAVRALVRAIILSPFAIRKSTLVHEFGHMLGFKDGYFRGYDDLGPDGYEVLEVILDPHDVVAAPEGGLVRREHFEQMLSERRRLQ